MLEKQVEAKLVSEVKKRGGLALKFVSPGFDGVPDRIVLMPGGKAIFVECKAPGKKLRVLQIYRSLQIGRLGFYCCYLDHPDKVVPLLEEVMSDEVYPS